MDLQEDDLRSTRMGLLRRKGNGDVEMWRCGDVEMLKSLKNKKMDQRVDPFFYLNIIHKSKSPHILNIIPFSSQTPASHQPMLEHSLTPTHYTLKL